MTPPTPSRITGDITNNSSWVTVSEQPDTSILNDRVFVRQAAIAAMQGLFSNPGGPLQANDSCGWGYVNCQPDDITEEAVNRAVALLSAIKEHEAK